MEKCLKSMARITILGENKDELVSIVISNKEEEIGILKTDINGISYDRYNLKSMEVNGDICPNNL